MISEGSEGADSPQPQSRKVLLIEGYRPPPRAAAASKEPDPPPSPPKDSPPNHG